MAITVGGLAELPHLGLSVVAGDSGLGRSISWANVSDLEEPWIYLAEGEMLLTNGLGLPSAEQQQLEFVQKLDSHRIAGIGLGGEEPFEKLFPSVHNRLNDLHLPLLRVPNDLPFVAIARAVADANQREEHVTGPRSSVHPE